MTNSYSYIIGSRVKHNIVASEPDVHTYCDSGQGTQNSLE